MGKHGTSRHHHASHRRDQFVPTARHPRRTSPFGAIVVLALLLAATFVYVVAFGGRDTSPGSATAVAGAGSDVRLTVATFADGAARFYRYTTAGGRELRFFVMQSSDGVIRAAADACDVCYRERKGYRQQGDVMVCNNCGKAFRSVDINVLQGGCNPAPLERTVQGGQVVLTASALEAGALYF